MPQQSRRIEAVEVTCEILDLLEERESAGVTELAEALGRSKSSVHAYLTTLKDQKYVVKSGGQYALSFRYLKLADQVKARLGKFEVIENEVDDLADTTGEVSQFATIEQGDLVYLYKAQGESAVETLSSIGVHETPHSTSLGKSILSHLPENEVRDILGSEPFEQKTENTITDYDTLFKELEKIRERGYATDIEENIMGLCCISAPVVLNKETVPGAVSVAGPTSRMTQDRIEAEYEGLVTSAANVIQLNINFS